MGKGSLPPIFEANFRELTRRGRSDTALDKSAANTSAASTSSSPVSRISLLPIARLTSFRRSSSLKPPPNHNKKPLLNLNLSSQSFLDSIIVDDRLKKPLYTIKTEGPTTRITRNISASTQFCTIRWPKTLPTMIKGKMVSDGVSIHLGDARWIGGENLLQRGSRPDSSRKFHLPNYSQLLKWKRYGNTCWCTTATVNGPVAVLELARDKTPTRLTIYETLHDKYDTKGVLSYRGVYIPLVDYLLVTAILLVTDLQDWMLVEQVEQRNIIVPNPTGSEGKGADTTASDVQWRKILYGEPLFPKITGEASSSYTRASDSESGISPITPLSPRPGHNRIYSQPSSIPAGASILSFSDEGYIHEERGTIRPLSPSMESQFYPGDGAPGHSYVDPSYPRRKSESTVPPVPPLPVEYQMSNRSLPVPLPSPNSPARPVRKLPMPPPIRDGHLIFGSSSSSSPRISSPSHAGDSASTSSAPNPTPVLVQRTRSTSNARARSRPLPAVPSPTHPLRRSRSDVLLDYAAANSESSRTPPPPPPLHISTSMSPPPSARSISGRSLPPTPRITDPASPHPDTIQEELRAAAFTVRAIRQQQHHLDSLRQQAHPIRGDFGRVDVLPPIVPSPRGSLKSEEEDIENWVRILTSPSSGGARDIPSMPPPAYNSLSFEQSSPLSGS